VTVGRNKSEPANALSSMLVTPFGIVVLAPMPSHLGSRRLRLGPTCAGASPAPGRAAGASRLGLGSINGELGHGLRPNAGFSDEEIQPRTFGFQGLAAKSLAGVKTQLPGDEALGGATRAFIDIFTAVWSAVRFGVNPML